MFRTVPLAINRSFSLYTQQWYMSCSLRAGSGRNCCVYSEKSPADGQRSCPKHVEIYPKNKFEKLVHLVGFVIRIQHIFDFFDKWDVAHRHAYMPLWLTFQSLPVTICTNSLTFNNCTLCPHCIYVFCIYLRTNSDLGHLQHKLIGFYNPHEKCLQCGTEWVFK